MWTRMVLICLVLVAPVAADTTILHVAGHTSGWRGAYNNSASYCWMDGWPTSSADACIADFDRSAVQTAINNELGTSGGWNAKLIVTQPQWISGNPQPPANLGPVAGIIQVDASTFAWGHVSDTAPNAFNAGNGSWRFSGTNYANFVAAYNASAAAGKSFSFTAGAGQWASVWDTALASACWDVVIDIPEDLVVRYMDNANAQGFFVSATAASPGLTIYLGDQWGRSADMRLLIAAPPNNAPWLNASILSLNRTIALTSPTYNQSVTVTNGGSGTLNWTAAETPDVSWISLGTPSGSAGGQFSIHVDVTGLAVGTHAADITITDSGAANKVTIPVTVSVVASGQPVIQLAPSSLTFSARPSDGTPPAAQQVTVNNTGLGTLNWTAVESPDSPWMSLASTTGTAGQKFTVNVNHVGLAAGVHTGTVQVSDPNAASSPLLTVTLNIQDQDADIVKANSYDDAWQDGPTGWVATRIQQRAGASGKTDGFVVLLGDSITYANPFSQWPRYGSGKTAADTTICNWMHAGDWGSGSNSSNNGWYLAAYDVPGRGGSFTARSGITSGQYLAGTNNLPSMDRMFTPGFTNPDGKQYADALMAVILLGTNDIAGNNVTQLSNNLSAILDKLENVKIIPIMTTVPPRSGADTTVANYNAAIRTLAQNRKVPLIDFWAEITRRRPGTTWQNTLMSSDGVHPSTSGGAYSSNSNPYTNSGEPLSNVGYLLRSWLTVQKIAEVKALVLDAPPPPAAPTSPNPASGAVDVSTSWTLSWSPGVAGTTFDVYFGTVNPPPLVSSDQSAATYAPPSMSEATLYYWKVVAKNVSGSTPGPVWSFLTHIPGDFNGDGHVDASDLALFDGSWNTDSGDPLNYDPLYDLNADGFINIIDLLILAQNWGM